MSPATRMSSHKVYGFPRVSGDEPPVGRVLRALV